jgi:hypothetical protein
MRLFDDYIKRRPLMERDGSGVSALLGLDGFVVSAQVLDEASGEWWLAVETTEDRTWCESCGVRAIGHGPPPGRGGGSAARRSAGDAGVGQAPVALRRRVRPGPGRRSPRRSRNGPC